jgi:hypothetical protein
MIGTTWLQIHQHSHLSLAEWLDVASEKRLQDIRVRQPTS